MSGSHPSDSNHDSSRRDNPLSNFAARFYSDRRLIVLTVVLAAASGLSSLLILPRMEDPLLTQRAANVLTIFPGADAEKVEALVTEKIEQQLLDSPDLKRIRSQSRAGSSFITIELRDDIYNTDPIWSDLRGKIEDSIAELPEGARRPIFDELDIAAYAWIGAMVWEGDSQPVPGVVRRLARDLKDQMLALPGTKSVDLFGDPQEEILVEIDPNRAAAAGLSAGAIALQLGNADAKSSAGTLRDRDTELVVEIGNEFNSMQDVMDAQLATNRPGETLQVKDVADVVRATADPPDSKVLVDGKFAVVVSVMLRPEYRIDEWAKSAQAVVDEYRASLPPNLKLDVVMEQEEYVSQRMETLARNLLLGVAAVALMTFIFMGWRSAVLVTATLPIASLMVVAGMRALSIPIHQMSVTGLIIALGLMIDNAIIATDEIQLSLRKGLGPKEAVKDLVARLFAPLLASTVTTALAFAPIALMEGPAGEFVGAIAITVMLAIFSSFLLAMTVLPATAALLQARAYSREATERKSRGFFKTMMQDGVSVASVTQLYRSLLTAMLRRPVTGIALGCLLPVAGFVSSVQLQEQFFPPADRDQFHIEVELAPQASLKQTEELVRRIDQSLASETRIKGTSWFLGESAPPFYYNVIARRKNSPNYGQAIVTLDSNRDALGLIQKLQLRLDHEFPEARVLVRQLEQGPPFDAPVEIRVLGADTKQLAALGNELRTLTTTLPDVLHSRTMAGESRPTASIQVDSGVSKWAGLSEVEVGQQLFASYEGLLAGSIIEQVEEVPVRVRLSAGNRATFEDLRQTQLLVSRNTEGLANARGSIQDSPALSSFVPLAEIADVSYAPQKAVITRYNGIRSNEVQTYITAGTLPSKVLGRFTEAVEETGFEERLPAGYRMEIGGEASERDAAISRLMANVSVLAVGMVAALVLALASFRLAALIGVVATLSIGLGLGALWLFGYPFGFMAIVGTMGLIGIAINDSIVVVSALKENPRVMAGDLEATVDTVIEVTRHVLATTGTTVFGFLPLLLSGGGFWPPLAVAIGTGVVGATLISVTLVPCVFKLVRFGAQQEQLASLEARPA